MTEKNPTIIPPDAGGSGEKENERQKPDDEVEKLEERERESLVTELFKELQEKGQPEYIWTREGVQIERLTKDNHSDSLGCINPQCLNFELSEKIKWFKNGDSDVIGVKEAPWQRQKDHLAAICECPLCHTHFWFHIDEVSSLRIKKRSTKFVNPP